MLRAELGVSLAELRGRVKTAADHAEVATPEPVQEYGKGKPGPGRGNKALDTIKSFGGTDPSYLTARMARDRPDILEGMKAGKYPSVRAAALRRRSFWCQDCIVSGRNCPLSVPDWHCRRRRAVSLWWGGCIKKE